MGTLGNAPQNCHLTVDLASQMVIFDRGPCIPRVMGRSDTPSPVHQAGFHKYGTQFSVIARSFFFEPVADVTWVHCSTDDLLPRRQ